MPASLSYRHLISTKSNTFNASNDNISVVGDDASSVDHDMVYNAVAVVVVDHGNDVLDHDNQVSEVASAYLYGDDSTDRDQNLILHRDKAQHLLKEHHREE